MVLARASIDKAEAGALSRIGSRRTRKPAPLRPARVRHPKTKDQNQSKPGPPNGFSGAHIARSIDLSRGAALFTTFVKGAGLVVGPIEILI